MAVKMMIRLEDAQHEFLAKCKADSGVPIAYLIRKALNLLIAQSSERQQKKGR